MLETCPDCFYARWKGDKCGNCGYKARWLKKKK